MQLTERRATRIVDRCGATGFRAQFLSVGIYLVVFYAIALARSASLALRDSGERKLGNISTRARHFYS